jgi:antitoxin VapB
MASLYIKDEIVSDRVKDFAQRLGVTQTETVRRALDALEASVPAAEKKRDLLAWLDDHRRRYPLPPPTGVKADKAFFDEMWSEDP